MSMSFPCPLSFSYRNKRRKDSLKEMKGKAKDKDTRVDDAPGELS